MKITPELLLALARLASSLPQLAIEIKNLVSHNGVTDQQWEDMTHVIAMNPEQYFAGARIDPDVPPMPNPQPQPIPPEDGSLYRRFLQSIPPLAELTRGDRIFTTPNGTLYYIIPGDATDNLGAAPGWSYFGWFDGTRIITASEDPNDAPRSLANAK